MSVKRKRASEPAETLALSSPIDATPEPSNAAPGGNSEAHAGSNGSTELYDPFDPENLRLPADLLKSGGVKKLLTIVPVRKPGKQDFIRVHPSSAYRITGAGIIELREDREIYLVEPRYAREVDPNSYSSCNIYLAINRQKVLFLWPVKLPGPDGRTNNWHLTAMEAAERAMTDWISIRPNMALGGYETYLPEVQLSEPEWPDTPMRDFLQIGFKGRFINGPDHDVMKRLRGAI
jgi:hypothetical protein